MIRRPPRSTLFPYTTLFRSLLFEKALAAQGVPDADVRLVTGELVELVRVVALPGEHERPGSRPGRPIGDGGVVVHSCCADRYPALDQVNVPEGDSHGDRRASATADDLLVGEI